MESPWWKSSFLASGSKKPTECPTTDLTRPILFTNFKEHHERHARRDRLKSVYELTAKPAMMQRYAEKEVVLSNAITYSHDKKRCSFQQYVDSDMQVPDLHTALSMDAKTTWYLCGDNFWNDVLEHYWRPTWIAGAEEGRGSLAFGVGRTGVLWHVRAVFFGSILRGCFPPSEMDQILS